MKRIFLITFIFCFVSISNGSFENTVCSAKAESLGEAFCAYGADLAAVYYNPSAIRLMGNSQFMFSYKNLFSFNLITQNSFIFFIPQKILNVGLSYNRIGTTKNADFEYVEEIFRASLASETKIKNLYIGVNISFFQVDSLMDASCYGLDFGMLYCIKENFLIGLIVGNFNRPTLYWNTGSEEIIDPIIRFGFRYSFFDRVIILGDYINTLEKNTINIGFEIPFLKDIFTLRCGINDAFLNNNYSFGFGIKYKKIDFNYAYKLHYSLKPTNVFTVSLLF